MVTYADIRAKQAEILKAEQEYIQRLREQPKGWSVFMKTHWNCQLHSGAILTAKNVRMFIFCGMGTIQNLRICE